jgi:hypothetical protein
MQKLICKSIKSELKTLSIFNNTLGNLTIDYKPIFKKNYFFGIEFRKSKINVFSKNLFNLISIKQGL